MGGRDDVCQTGFAHIATGLVLIAIMHDNLHAVQVTCDHPQGVCVPRSFGEIAQVLPEASGRSVRYAGRGAIPIAVLGRIGIG